MPESLDNGGHEILNRQTQRIDNFVQEYQDVIHRRLDEEYARTTTRSDRLADKIASFGGSWRFIILFGLLLGLWMTWNTLQGTRHFDNPPFILLNLLLSFLAAFQAPIIMMSQNRAEVRDKQATVIDFAIDYKAETELQDIQAHLHRIEDDLREIKHLLADFKP